LNLIFALSAVLLLLSVVAMVAEDYVREWKAFQRDFTRDEVKRLEGEIQSAEAGIDSTRLRTLRDELAAANQTLKGREATLKSTRSAYTAAQGHWYKLDQDYRFTKAIYDSERYAFEEAVSHSARDAEALGRRNEARRQKMVELRDEALEAAEVRDAAKTELSAATADRDSVTKGISELYSKVTGLEKQLKAVGPNFQNRFRNAPVVDFFDPTVKVSQTIIDDQKLNINFAEIPRTDRCTTCHLTIEQVGYEDRPNPYKTHPRLDLYLARTSPHPGDQFACTGCHSGRGWGTTFERTAHTPRDEHQAEEWEKKYGWEEMHYWDYPMLRLQDTQSACFKCHKQEVRIEGADRLNEARLMYIRAGCWGCHKTEGYKNLRKVGPSLEQIKTKTNPDWAYFWVLDPPAFRPTRMPKFFGLSNSSSPEDGARNRAEVGAMVDYIFAKSGELTYDRGAPARGDTARGRQLVETIGCYGCHVIGNEGDLAWADPRRFGPNLAGTGSKVNESWLYHWLKDPRHYWRETRMPDLRLTDSEASDITAFLLNLRREGFEDFRRPAAAPEILKTIGLEYLMQRMTRAEAESAWQEKSAGDQVQYVGEKLIGRYGCFGCHDIPGFENTQPIGVELSKHAEKPLFQLDFGFVDIHHGRRDFFAQKLKDPRIYDLGRVKPPQDKLKMPQFDFTDEEVELMTLNLLGFTKETVAITKMPQRSPVQVDTERGWWLTHERNCIGCHSFDGYGGAIASTLSDPALAPPMIRREGAKVNPDWLFRFLKEPSSIRPWLSARMPTFHLDDPTATDLVKYFVALEDETLRFRSQVADQSNHQDLQAGAQLFKELQCQKCHVVGGQLPGGTPADWAPDLALAHDRLQHDWILEWLRDPQKWLPGTRMPNFFFYYDDGEQKYIELMPDGELKAGLVRDYVLSLGQHRLAATARASRPAGD
jgi:cytochrome c2